MRIAFAVLVICGVCLLAIYEIISSRLEPGRISHIVQATVERHLYPGISPLSLSFTPISKPSNALFCPNEKSTSFAKTAPSIWFDPRLSGGAHTWIFNGAEVVKALSAYCGQTRLNSELLIQIRDLLDPVKMPTATGGYQDQKQLGAALLFLLAKRTPIIWNRLSQREQTLINLIMEAFLYSSTFTTKDQIAGSLGMNGDTNLNRDWNPNYQDGMVGMVIVTALYWGFAEFETKLAAYDDTAFVAKLRVDKMNNLLATYTNPRRPSGAFVQAGLRKIVNGEIYRFHGISERDLIGLFSYIATRSFSATISCGLNKGAGIDGYGRIARSCNLLPNIGQKGMMLEFDSWDAEGKRSSADYSWGAWYVLNYSRAALQIEGWLTAAALQQSATLAETMDRYRLGSIDLLFKILPYKGGGYFDYDHGKPAELIVLDQDFARKYGANANLDLFNLLQRNLGLAEIEN